MRSVVVVVRISVKDVDTSNRFASTRSCILGILKVHRSFYTASNSCVCHGQGCTNQLDQATVATELLCSDS
jgi:hypothetical protein